MARMPQSVRVGPFDWSIVLEEPDGAWGDTNFEKLRIRVSPNIEPAAQRETLLHELMHACHLSNGVESDKQTDPETVISAVSATLSDTLQRNPGLIRYLFGAR